MYCVSSSAGESTSDKKCTLCVSRDADEITCTHGYGIDETVSK